MAPGITLPELLGIIMDLSLQNTCEIRELLLTNCSRQQQGDSSEAVPMAWGSSGLPRSPLHLPCPLRTETLPGKKAQLKRTVP